MSEQARRVIEAARRSGAPVDVYVTPGDRLVIVPVGSARCGRYTAGADPAWIAEDLAAVLGERRAQKSET